MEEIIIIGYCSITENEDGTCQIDVQGYPFFNTICSSKIEAVFLCYVINEIIKKLQFKEQYRIIEKQKEALKQFLESLEEQEKIIRKYQKKTLQAEEWINNYFKRLQEALEESSSPSFY